jgi:peptidoglycan/LPS O-acetylase OafA/YrhL
MIKSRYFPGLDAIRALAISMVLWWHYIAAITKENRFPKLIQLLLDYTGITWSGVDLFFVLSGFLITNLLFNLKNELKCKKYFINFYIRRIFRIFPPYFFLLLFHFILINHFEFKTLVNNIDSDFSMWEYVFFVQNFSMVNSGFGPYFLGATWSLSIEEQFYTILPFIIYFLPTRKLIYIFLLGIITAPFFRFYFSNTELGSFVLLVSRMDSLFIGSLIAYFYYYNLYNQPADKIRKFSLCLLLLIIPFFILIKIKYNLHIGSPLLHTLLAFIYGLVVLYALLSKINTQKKIIYKYIITPLAKLSYMVYLIHEIVLSLCHQIFLNQKPEIYNFSTFAITIFSLFLTLLFSLFFYKWVESPLIRYSKNF